MMQCLRRTPSRLIRVGAFSRPYRAANLNLRIPTAYNFTSQYASALQVRLNSGQTTVDPHPSQNPDELQDQDNTDKPQLAEAVPQEEENKPTEGETEDEPESMEKFYDELFTPSQQAPQGVTPGETVYVGNLFWDTKAEDLRARMEKFGTVVTALVAHDDRGLSKGFGYVEFSSVDEANLAIERQHMKMFQGRKAIVQHARAKKIKRPKGDQSIKPSNTLFIGNIPYELTDRDLQELFSDVFNFVDIRIPVDRRQGTCRGFAHADFIDIEAAQAAKEVLARKKPYGRKLSVAYAKVKSIGTKPESMSSSAGEAREE